MRTLLLTLKGITALMCVLLTKTNQGQTFKFAELTGTPIATAGWNLQGAAYVGNTGTNNGNGEIILTETRSSAGSIFFNRPINLAICNKWIAEFEFRINGGNAADGLAFCYLDVPPVGFGNGGGLGIPRAANGLKICIDTYWNGFDPANPCPNGMPKLQMRWGNGYQECEPTQPTLLNTAGELSFIRNGDYHKARITYDRGNITLSINGKQYLTGFQTFNFTGYFGFTAGTGNNFDIHSIKNVQIFTDMPQSEAGNGATICSGATAQIGLATPNPIYTYNWLPATGLDNPKIVNPKVTLTHNGPKPLVQKYYMYTEFAAIPGCSSVDSIEVVVNPVPNVSISTSGICFNDTMKIVPKTNWPDSIAQTLKWLWNFNDPLASPANNQSSLPIGMHKYANAGSYNVGVTTTTREGCVQTLSLPVAVRPVPPAAFSIANSGAVCVNEPVLLVQRVNAGTKGSTSIVLDVMAGGPVLNFNKLFAPGDTIRINYRQAGIVEGKPFYLTKWRNIDSFGCAGEAVDTLVFRAQPKPVINSQSGVCLDVPPFQFPGGNETTGIAGTGYFTGNGIVNPTGTFNPRLAGAGQHTIRYIYAASNGCIDTASSSFAVFALPAIDAGPNKFLLPGGYVVLEGSSNLPAASILWSPPTALSNATVLKPEARPTTDILYKLLVTSQQGCKATDSVWVKALPPLKIPNAFSPHLADGINDVWVIKNLDLFPNAVTIVYDRYGREVYKSEGYNRPWDGKRNGVLVPVGVYYFLIDPKNGNKTYVGSVTLL